MKGTQYYSSGMVLLRTPAFPIDPITKIPNDLQEFFKPLVKNDFFMRAICIASVNLYQKALKWQAGTIQDKKEEQKLLQSLFKYWLRMTSRCTPYGSFAGCALGNVSDSTQLVLNNKENHSFHFRIDMDFLSALIQDLLKMPAVRSHVKYFPNNSLYAVHDEYRYVEYTMIDNARAYKVSEVLAQEHLQLVLDHVVKGKTIQSLCDLLTGDEISAHEALQYVEELIDNRILVSELEPAITGRPFLDVLTEKLHGLNELAPLVDSLIQVKEILKNKALSIREYTEVNNILKSLLPGNAARDLLQTDLFLSTKKVSLKKGIVSDIIGIAEKIMRINPDGSDALKVFKKRFLERYETAEMPLMYVLDPEAGIGYDNFTNANADQSVLLSGIDVNAKLDSGMQANWNSFRDYQLAKLDYALRHNLTTITISDEELEVLLNSDVQLPESIAIMGSLLAKDRNEVDQGNYHFYLQSCAGPAAANILGRFCYANEQLAAQVTSCLQQEESHHADHVYAEIVHLPQARVGNVLIRPALRKYEIPYLCNSSVDAENQILVSDLFVSVKNDEVVLRSKRLNKRVIPRLSSAHNFRAPSSLPVYKFLCSLQAQNIAASFSWDWGKLCNVPYLPRVTYGKVILKRAQWFIDNKYLTALPGRKAGDVADHFRQVQTDLKIPRQVLLIEGDNELVIDFTNEQSLRLLADYLHKHESVKLEEFLGIPDQCIVQNEAGEKFTHELVIPVCKVKTNPDNVLPPRAVVDANHVKRTFTLGSEWLYLKIYCGTKTAEKVLKEIIRPLTSFLLNASLIDKWFYIRYNDPDYHIRVRFHSISPDYWAVVLKEFNNMASVFIDDKLIQRVQVDTYQRELERYGYDTTEISEDFFYHDSEAILKFICGLENDDDETLRWLIALRNTDRILDDIGFSLQEKNVFCKKMSQQYLKEFEDETSLLKQINGKYRTEVKVISNYLNPLLDEINGIVQIADIFRQRYENVASVFHKIRAAYINNADELDAIVSSYVHMSLNRLFTSNQRQQELVVYNFLYRYYESSLAILRKQGQSAMQSKI